MPRVVLVLPLLLAACLSPAREAPTPAPADPAPQVVSEAPGEIADVAAPPDAIDVAVSAAIEEENARANRKGVLRRLFGKKSDAPEADPIQPISAVEVAEGEVAPSGETSDTPTTPVIEPAVQTALTEAPDEPERRFLGLFRRAPKPDDKAGNDSKKARQAPEPRPAEILMTEVPEEADPLDEDLPELRTARVGGGLLGLFRRGDKAARVPDTPDLPDDPGGVAGVDGPVGGDPTRQTSFIPNFGAVQQVCGQKRSTFGKEVLRWPETGRKAYRIYDTKPGSDGVRDYYITGFTDKCPRRFRATIVFFGAPSVYETVRFDPANRKIKPTATDAAYDKLKRKICGAGPRKPCGAKIDRMDRSTVFITAYDSFGNSTRWAEFLLYEGELMEVALKSR